jgi:hypothetical protein
MATPPAEIVPYIRQPSNTGINLTPGEAATASPDT